MKLLSSFGISRRLYGAAAVLALALLSVAVFAYVRLGDVADLARVTGNVRAPQLARMGDIELAVTRASLQLRHAMLARTPEEQATALADVGAQRRTIDGLVAAFERDLTTDEGRRRLAVLKPQLAKFWQVGVPNVGLIEEGKKAEAFAYLVDKTIPARNELLASLAATGTYQQERLTQDIEAIQAGARHTLALLEVLVIATVVGVLLLAWHVSAVLRRRVALAQRVTQRVRDGDLSEIVHDDARDEFSPLLASLQEMQAQLTRVVRGVRGNAESVATASTQIAQGNQDLSGRTEQQASALQEAAATMDELGATVRLNADNAHQAAELARGASSVATEGGSVVAEVVQTMKGINDSSRKIADIIGVIDGIAFQTNILALNAAVEAARAGEQGRGFAVVATEVRNLAQRSAEAAREIKALITASVEQVEHGSTLVDRAGATTQEIVGAIHRVSDIVSEISAASAEQSAGVGQVGQAVTQMDQSTQQNAALVEQSAAAAESLRQQAQQLVQAVSAFRLAGDASAGAMAGVALPVLTEESRPPAGGWDGGERRGPDRANNVTRPAFGKPAAGAKASKTTAASGAAASVASAGPVAAAAVAAPASDIASPASASPALPAPARTGTDDDWQSF
ncbi:MAG: MCP four helix bundle domain-containing protein [Rubrivivax sp.]|nr:MCP four helix bundle domain-containing protein [Rubrivivax sp.]MCL4696442.1 MCP four helix bundle domain-containing protein [Burkholderiaceae bacterium]